MAWTFRGVSIVTALLLWSVTTAAARQNVDPRRIDEAIDHAKQWIYQQQKDGNWEQKIPGQGGHGDQTTGYTALAAFALLTAGESHQDERIKRAVDYLLAHETTGVYALGLRCQVWLMLPQTEEIKKAMRKDARILLDSIQRDGPGKGFYGYNPTEKAYSHSRGHYGVLGVWAAAQSGVEVPAAYWRLVETAWIAHQDPSGGWTYKARSETEHPLTPNMTASAVATLFITQEYLRANEGVACRGNIRNPAIDKGIEWLAANFDKIATDTKYDRDYPYNTMYGLERVGVASGYKYIANVDWFQHGARWLLKKQRKDGGWPSEYGNLTSTSFSLIFLARGRAPVAVNKLDYSAAVTDPKKQPPWNQRPRDVANLVRWIGRQSERELNWQIVNLAAPLNDLLDAPLLYLSGNQPLAFDDEFKAKLKSYIEHGGLVLANADCQSKPFANSFRNLGKELFPEYEFRELPAEHPIYSNQQFPRSKWKAKPSVLAMSNGARELMILIPQADVAKTWQLQLVGGREEFWQLAADVFFYAIDKQHVRNKGETYQIARDDKIKPQRTVRVARIAYNGNWNPEPAGWPRFANWMHNRHKTALDVVNINVDTESLDGFQIAHLTGTAKFSLGEAARAKVKTFVESGGTLIIDAAGGSTEFAQAAEQELLAIFPGTTLKALDANDAAFGSGSAQLTEFRYRPFAQRALGTIKDAPRIMALQHGGRNLVYVSREDLSVGLIGAPVDGIVGYDPQTALELAGRLILSVSE